MALAIQQRGIDITDQSALDDFVAEVNRTVGSTCLPTRWRTWRRLR